MPPIRRCLPLLLYLALSQQGQAEEGPALRTDRFGDPLPAGAVARLGSVRLRHPEEVKALALSTNGKLVASGGAEGTIRLWETATGKLVRQFMEGNYRIEYLSFAPDGRILAASITPLGREVGEVRLWDVASGREIRRLRQWSTESLAFSPDGKILAVVGCLSPPAGDSLLLWDVRAGRELRRLPSPHPISCLAFSPDGKTLASGHIIESKEGRSGAVGIWEVATGRRLHWLGDLKEKITSVAFTGNGKFLLAGVKYIKDIQCYVWTTASGELARTLWKRDVSGVCCLNPGADGRVLALCGSSESEAGMIQDADTGKVVSRLEGSDDYDLAAFSGDGRIVAQGNNAGVIDLWDVRTGKRLHPRRGHQHAIENIFFAPDGCTLATQGKAVRFWEAATGREIRSLDTAGKSVAISSDFRFLATGYSGPIQLWDIRSGKLIRSFGKDGDGPLSIAFAPDGKTIATGGYQGEIILWDASTGRQLRKLGTDEKIRKRICLHIAFAPDGKTLMAKDGGSPMVFWEVATGTPCVRIDHRTFDREGFALSSDGELLALAESQVSGDGPKTPIYLWKFATGKLRGRLKDDGHNRELVFSPDGRTLAVAGSPNPIRLYEVASGQVRLCLPGQAPLAFAPDGKTLAGAEGETTALLWDLLGLQRAKKPRLTAAERQTLWADLASADAARAYRSMGRLIAAPADALKLLQSNLEPAPVEEPTIARLIRDLDDDRFAVRERASQELEARGDRAEPALRAALADKPSLELRRRVERVLELLQWPIRSPRMLREVRAVEVLEYIGTRQADQLLEKLARGAPQAQLTREAKRSLRHRKAGAPGKEK